MGLSNILSEVAGSELRGNPGIASIVAAQTVMRLEEERQKKLKEKPKGIIFGRGNPMPLSSGEITEIATKTADKVMEQIRFGGSEEGLAAAKDAVLGVGAYIMPERRGTKGPCTCCIIDPSKPIVPKNLMCTTTGAIGTLKDSEEEELCDELIFVKDGRCARARGLREAAKECKEEYPDDTKRFFECYIPKFSKITKGSNPTEEGFTKGQPIVIKSKAIYGWRASVTVEKDDPEHNQVLVKETNIPIKYEDIEEEEESNPSEYITITDPGKTTFKVGEVTSREAFERENERVRKLGEKPATGR